MAEHDAPLVPIDQSIAQVRKMVVSPKTAAAGRDAVSQLLVHDGSNRALLALLVRAQIALGKPDEALEVLRDLPMPRTSEERTLELRAALAAGDMDRARAAYADRQAVDHRRAFPSVLRLWPANRFISLVIALIGTAAGLLHWWPLAATDSLLAVVYGAFAYHVTRNPYVARFVFLLLALIWIVYAIAQVWVYG